METGIHFLHSHSRVVFLVTLILVHASAWFGSRKSFVVHGVLMLVATASITALFIAGIMVRGLMGSVGTVEHGPLFYPALILHILSGAAFLLMAAFLLFPTGIGRLTSNRWQWLFSRHGPLGTWAVRAITISVLSLVVM